MEDLKLYVEKKYGHLSAIIRQQILDAYIDSNKRNPEVFDIDRSVLAGCSTLSVDYKDSLFNDTAN